MTSRGTLARWLISQTKDLLPPLGISIIARIINQLLGIALLIQAARVVLEIALGHHPGIPAAIGTLAGLALAKALLRYVEHYAGHFVAFAALQRLREVFFAALIPQAPAATQGRAGSELTERATSDIDRIEVFFAHTFPPAISAVLVPTITLAWLGTQVDPLLAAILAPCIAAAIIILPILTTSHSWVHARTIATRRGKIAEELGDDIQGVREILGFGAQQARLARLSAADDALIAARCRAGISSGFHNGLVTAIQLASLLIVAFVGVSNDLGAEKIILTVATAVALWGPAAGIDDFTSGLDSAFAATARIHEVITAEPEVTDTQARTDLTARRGGRIHVDAVSYSYGKGKPSLDQVSLTIAPGSWSYLVGISGSGKSTLATLLVRGRDPQQGTLLLDGTDLRHFTLDDLRSRIQLVQQRPTMLSVTLAENLRLGNPQAGEDELIEALRVVELADWVAGLPEGLETPVSERGLNTSGGQLQRLSLARALIARPEVLILDEALSQLDGPTAAHVRQHLAAQPGLTVVEITHRTDLIPDSAQVSVLDAGRVVEQGTAGQLRSAAGAFHQLSERE